MCISFWASGPFVTSFELERRTLSVSFYRVFESCYVWLFFVIFVYVKYYFTSCRNHSLLFMFRIVLHYILNIMYLFVFSFS